VKHARWLRTRIEGEEWLDQGLGTVEAVEQSLGDLNRINRWLGGMRSLVCHLYPRIRDCQAAPVKLLDLGAGGCAIPMAIARWARAEKTPIWVLALDRRHPHLRWAQRRIRNWPEISLLQGDAWAPPFPDRSVDIVISSLFLHHFSEAELLELLPRWVRLARRSLVMSDLVRHPLPYWFMKATSPVFARSPLTRHDAAVSIRRAYRPQELHAVATAAGLRKVQIFRHFPYRMTLVIDHAEARPTC
jgi:2-polyprenyl-3-methyl-5-hydroxy-6-metoxy-1,4-benzoquinol methylase